MATRKDWEFEAGNISTGKTKGLGEIGGGRSGTQGLYEQSSTPHFPLGYRLAMDDGRVYRYAHFGTAVTTAGKLCGIPAVSQVIADTRAVAVVDSAGTAKDYASSDTVKTIYLKDSDFFTSAHSDDALAGGFLTICSNAHHAAGQGQQYRIRSNDYTATTSIMRLDLYDNLALNLGSEAEVAVTGCMYRELMTATYSGTAMVVAGVNVVAMSAGYYGWVQTWGIASCLADGSTIAAGAVLTLSDDTAGAVQRMGGSHLESELVTGSDLSIYVTDPIVGFAIAAGVSGHSLALYLQLAP